MPRISRTTFIAAVIAALLAGFGLAFFVRRKKVLRDQSETVETGLGTIEYGTLGKGGPVLVLHGAGGGFDQGLHMTAPLAEEGFRLIAPSRFGYLRSTAPKDASPAKQAEAYARLLDTLGIKQVNVLAISAGAWSALYFALRYPERCRALVLLVPATKLAPLTRLYSLVMTHTLFRCDLLGGPALRLAALFPRIGATLLGTKLGHATSEERQRVKQLLRDGLPVRAHSKGMKIDLTAMQPHNGFPMRGIIAPVLAISTADDGFQTAARAKEIAQTVRNGRAIVFPTGGHLLVERLHDTIREVAAFLKG